MTTKYDYLLMAIILTGLSGCGNEGRMLPTTPTFKLPPFSAITTYQKEICKVKCSPLIKELDEAKYYACFQDCINNDFSPTASGTITIIAASSGTITF